MCFTELAERVEYGNYVNGRHHARPDAHLNDQISTLYHIMLFDSTLYKVVLSLSLYIYIYVYV